MIRRKALIAIVASAFIALLVVPAASAASEAKPTLLTSETAAVVVGDTVWLALMWEASGDLRNFEVTVSDSDGAVIGYPANTVDRAAPNQSADLLAGEIDYTAISFRYPQEAKPPKNAKMTIVATWDGDKRIESDRFKVTVPLLVYEGDDLKRVTESVSVPAGQVEWVEIAYSGLAPRLTDFSLVVTAPEGVEVVYPGERSVTSLHFDATLEDGETDVARFRIDASAAEPGVFDLGLLTSFNRGDTYLEIPEVISLEIVP